MATPVLENKKVTVPESYLPNRSQLILLQDNCHTPYLLSISRDLSRWAHRQDNVDKRYKEKSPEVWNLLTPLQDFAEEVSRIVVQNYINKYERGDGDEIEISHEYAFDFISRRNDIRPQLEIFICGNIRETLELESASRSNPLIAQTLYYSSYLYFRNIA